MEKRSISLFVFFCLCFTGLMLRIAFIGSSEFSSVSQGRSRRTVTVGESRGKIYDRNLKKLVDRENKLIAAVSPVVGSVDFLGFMSDMDSFNNKITNGAPFAVEVNEKINNEFIRTFDVPVRYTENQPAVHLIGYLTSDGKSGVSGLEKAYNSFLKKNGGSLTVSFEVDAKGRVLAGMDKYVNDNNFNSQSGIVLTLDRDIQLAVENILEKSSVKSGCALVIRTDTGEIIAAASVPIYNPCNVAEALYKDNSPLINKVLQQYSVGSVFKPLIAAVALENGISPETEYECTGECSVGEESFACYNSTAHGTVNMQQALENSCNCYFIELMNRIDMEHLLKLCRDIGIGEGDSIASGINTSSGRIPDEKELKIKGEAANLAFGQGSLLMTPIQMAKLYTVLATGNLVSPELIYGLMNDDGRVSLKEKEAPQKLLTDSTVKEIKKMLSSVVERGNADKAFSEKVLLAGKTGTAQSGIFNNGKEICRTWFAGFCPADNPRYTVIVMNEDGTTGNADCAPVFSKICEELINCE